MNEAYERHIENEKLGHPRMPRWGWLTFVVVAAVAACVPWLVKWALGW